MLMENHKVLLCTKKRKKIKTNFYKYNILKLVGCARRWLYTESGKGMPGAKIK